jgi:hypothetical protein
MEQALLLESNSPVTASPVQIFAHEIIVAGTRKCQTSFEKSEDTSEVSASGEESTSTSTDNGGFNSDGQRTTSESSESQSG